MDLCNTLNIEVENGLGVLERVSKIQQTEGWGDVDCPNEVKKCYVMICLGEKRGQRKREWQKLPLHWKREIGKREKVYWLLYTI